MDYKRVNSEASFSQWLEGARPEWAQAIALRSALRALPLVANDDNSWLKNFALLQLGAVITSWIQLTEPSIDIFKGSRSNGRFGGQNFDFERYNGDPVAAIAANASYHLAEAQTRSWHLLNDCVDCVSKAAAAFAMTFKLNTGVGFIDRSGNSALWDSVQNDCDWLVKTNPFRKLRKRIEVEPLWTSENPRSWMDKFLHYQLELLEIDSNYSVWIDWYDRRIRGERAAFDIPGDKYRKEDKKILRRLAEATDEDFWGKGHEYVNATLKGWLDEARVRVAPQTTIAVPIGFATEAEEALSLTIAVPSIPEQNSNAISFRQEENGRIGIDAFALADKLRTTASARDRYAESVTEARNALARCHGNNAAVRLTRLFDNYLGAAGEALEDVKPSLLVQRGERLRQELARHQAPDHMLAPVADDLLLDIKGWEIAHNMMVGLDPVLHAMDTAMLGPDRQPLLLSPDEIRETARKASEAELLADGVVDILEEAADLAPAIPDSNDRHTIWSTEMVRNLMIETASVALNNPVKTGAIITSLAEGGVMGGISVMGSIKAAEYLVTHKEWVLSRLGDTPTWRALIAKLIEWLKKVTPFEPKD